MISRLTDPSRTPSPEQPEGQAVISELLAKAHELMGQVQNKL